MENRTTIQISEDTRKEIRMLTSKRDISYQELISDMIDVFKELDRNKSVISIPLKLYEKVRAKIKETDFNSVSEYTTYLLRQLLSEGVGKDKIAKSDEDKVREKLAKLGYI